MTAQATTKPKTETIGRLRLEIRLLKSEIKSLRFALNKATLGLSGMLKNRGFVVHSADSSDDLVIPAKKHMNKYFSLMNKYSFRLFMRDVIKYQDGFGLEDVTRYATPEVTRDYITGLSTMGLIERKGKIWRLKKRPIKSFGATLEWLTAEIMKSEFGAEAIRGVKFKGHTAGGDFDVIAKIEGRLCYVEVKSSPPKQIYDAEIDAFLRRTLELNPDRAVLFLDTELRMKDKIVPMMESAAKRLGLSSAPARRIHRELFMLTPKIFIINSKDSIAANLHRAMMGRGET